jgi:site-specific recombinase XerD
MRARGYARQTLWTRMTVARDWVAGHPDLDDADHADVEDWATAKNLAASSIRNQLVNLRAFYRWAMRAGIATHDPTVLVDRPRIPMALPRPAPEHDIARLYETGDTQLRAIVALMACAGLRCVECSRLDWRDVDFAAATVIVNGKGRRERLIDLSPDVVRAVAALALATRRTCGAVFTGPTGVRLSPARVSQRINRALRDLGVPTTTAHQLRHRCATMALAQPGVDLLAVRDLLGHSSVSTTQIYTAVVPGRTAAASRALTLPTTRRAAAELEPPRLFALPDGDTAPSAVAQ